MTSPLSLAFSTCWLLSLTFISDQMSPAGRHCPTLCAHRPASSSSPGRLLEMQALRPHPPPHCIGVWTPARSPGGSPTGSAFRGPAIWGISSSCLPESASHPRCFAPENNLSYRCPRDQHVSYSPELDLGHINMDFLNGSKGTDYLTLNCITIVFNSPFITVSLSSF